MTCMGLNFENLKKRKTRYEKTFKEDENNLVINTTGGKKEYQNEANLTDKMKKRFPSTEFVFRFKHKELEFDYFVFVFEEKGKTFAIRTEIKKDLTFNSQPYYFRDDYLFGATLVKSKFKKWIEEFEEELKELNEFRLVHLFL